MKPASRRAALLGGAIVGVPVAFGAYVFTEYRLALRQGYLPITLYPEWYWFAAFGICLTIGIILICLSTPRRLWLQLGVVIVYAAAMTVGLLATHFVVACANGDCL